MIRETETHPFHRAADYSRWHDRVLAHRHQRRVDGRRMGAYGMMYLHPVVVNELGLTAVRAHADRLRGDLHGSWAEAGYDAEPGRVRFHLEYDADGAYPDLLILSAILLPDGEVLVDPRHPDATISAP